VNARAGLDRAFVGMATSGSITVRDDGEWLAEPATRRCEFPSGGKNPLLQPWSRGSNLTRRIMRKRHAEPGGIPLTNGQK
jgi:hypothetical protein